MLKDIIDAYTPSERKLLNITNSLKLSKCNWNVENYKLPPVKTPETER